MSWLVNLISGIFGGGAQKLVATVWGDQAERERMAHLRDMSVHGQFAAEFRNLTHRTWWDSLIDGLNRLPRPVMVTLIIYYFVTAYVDPVQFQQINVALDTVPEPMWYVLSALVGFYFAARELHKHRSTKLALTEQQFNEVQRRMNKLQAADEPLMAEEEFQGEMADTSKPLSNRAIAEWNRRRRH